MSEPTTNCLNCNTNLQPDQHYCAACGQKAVMHRLSFHEIGHDAFHYFTHADKGILHLLKELALHPGTVAREYIEGKRKKYFKPLNFYLLVAGLVVFMTSTLYQPAEYSRRPATNQRATVEPTAAQLAQYKKMGERARKVGVITGKYSNIINMVATPLLATFIWLMYVRGKYNYVEHLVANMYFVGFIMLFYAFIIVPIRYFIPPTASTALIGVFFLFEIIYRGNAYYHFINKKGSMAKLKAYATSIAVSIIWVLLTYSIIALYIQTGLGLD